MTPFVRDQAGWHRARVINRDLGLETTALLLQIRRSRGRKQKHVRNIQGYTGFFVNFE